MSLIESLTSEQQALMAMVRDEWLAVGLSTAPADRPRAEAAINRMYDIGKVARPKRIVWCGSPLSQGITRSVIMDFPKADSVGASVRDSVGASVWDSVWASVGASVGASVRASVWASVGASVRDSVWDSVRDSVRDSVWDSVWDGVRDGVRASVRASVGASVGDSVRDSVWDSVRDSAWDSVWDSVGDSVYGQHEAGWLAFYDYFHRIGLIAQTQNLVGLWEVARSTGWVLPHTNICWVSERHNIVSLDDQGRIHNPSGPAIHYPDGFSIHGWHGVRVPAQVIEAPETLDPRQITSEPNAEVRRVMLERFGAPRYFAAIGAKRIQADDYGELYRAEFPDDEPLVMAKVTNSTAESDGSFKDYWLRVPPQIERCHEAVAWSFGKNVKEYEPSIET